MKFQYLGTGAAEGIPAMFCQCELCRLASARGGKDIRTRAGALINDTLLLDLTPDLYYHKLRYQLDLSQVTAVCVTHSHTDHFDGAELTRRSTANYCHVENEKPLQVYGNEAVCRFGKESLRVEFGEEIDPSIEFYVAKAYKPFEVGTVRVTPLPSVHDQRENCLIYLLEEGEHRVLYASDSGLLLPEVYEFLQGKHLSMVSMDCTFGATGHTSAEHMGVMENRMIVDQLERCGCVDASTLVLATHFSHNCGMGHEELKQALGRYGIQVAYDGRLVSIKSSDGFACK